MSDFDQFQEYYKEHMPAIYAYVHVRVGYNRAIAEDIVSEVFLKALEKFETFSEKEGTFKSWIFKITKNHLIDYYRSKKNKGNASLDEISNIISGKEDPHKDTEKVTEKEKLKEILHTLPENKQEMIALRYFAEYSYKEIAEILQQDENKIRVTIHRALKTLKQKLYELEYNPD